MGSISIKFLSPSGSHTQYLSFHMSKFFMSLFFPQMILYILFCLLLFPINNLYFSFQKIFIPPTILDIFNYSTKCSLQMVCSIQYLTQALLWLFDMYYKWLKLAQFFLMTPTYWTVQFRLLWGPSPALVWLLPYFAFFLHLWNYLKTRLSWINHFLLGYLLVDNVLRIWVTLILF